MNLKEVFVKNLPVKPTRVWGDISLFRFLDSLELIKYCENHNIAILGIEGFRINNNKIIPDMEYIIDFSELLKNFRGDFTNKSLKVSRKIIQEIQDKDLYLEFLLVALSD